MVIASSRLVFVLVIASLAATPVRAQAPASPAPTPPAADGAAPVDAQPASQPPAPAPVAPAAPLALGLDGPAGMVFHVVKADRGPDFEQLFARLQAGLSASSVETRRQQAAGWRLLKQNAPTAEGHLVYVSVIDPVVAGAEYDLARLLAEAFPDEGLALYQTLIAVHVQPTVQATSLTPVTAPGAQP